MINQYDKHGHRHGTWESYFPNGNLYYKGAYSHGHFHGLWEDYYEDGNLYIKGERKKNEKAGLWYEKRWGNK